MRSVKITFGLAVAICALAISASSALAHQFVYSIAGKTISPAEPAKLTAIGEEQYVKINGGNIYCEKVKATGLATSESSEELKLALKFNKCYNPVKDFGGVIDLPTRFVAKGENKASMEFTFHANGFGEVGTEGEEASVEVGEGTGEIKVLGGKACVISWEHQTVPIKAEKKPEEEYNAATFSNLEEANSHLKAFPSGFQKKLVIANVFKSMKYSFVEGQCSEFEKGTEGHTAKYEGNLTTTLVNGNVSFE
ncbi:MAG TPA: hypothetical protein VKG62_06765 [Solirubrobacteraceae bacterium]|nr:hypothetical protein [Solirubrobacteraceae bacterium]